MTTKEKLKMAQDACDQLTILNNISWTPYWSNYFNQVLREEREHRSGGDFARHHTSDTVSAVDAASIVALQVLASYLEGKRKVSVSDFLHTKVSHFHAAALATQYPKEIRKALEAFPMAEILALDYCEFVKVRKEVA